MLNTNKEIKNIGKDIWVIKNFVTNDEIKNIKNVLNSIKKEDWNCDHPDGHCRINLIDYVGKFTQRIQSMLPDGLFVHEIGAVNKLSINQGHGIHSDNHDFLEVRNLNKLIKEFDEFKWVDNNVFGLVIYLNDDYEGGEIFYTKQNITYKPESGDLIIHSAEEHCEHGVHPVKTNVRYSISSSIREKIKNPI